MNDIEPGDLEVWMVGLLLRFGQLWVGVCPRGTVAAYKTQRATVECQCCGSVVTLERMATDQADVLDRIRALAATNEPEYLQ